MGPRTRWLAVAGVVLALALAAQPASAAFAGRDGALVSAPLHGRGLVLATARGGRVRRLCDAPQRCGGRLADPRVSPNGKEIVFTGPHSRIEVATVSGACLWCLDSRSVSHMSGTAPAFTPDGTAVTFVHRGLWELTLGTTSPKRLLKAPVSAVAWSSSGALAVVRAGWVWARNGKADGAQGLRRVARGAAPAWSPDGRTLAYTHRGMVFLTRLDRHTLTRIARGAAPAFSPDGHTLAYLAPDHAVTLRPLTASHPRPRTLAQVKGESFDWQPVTARTAQSCRQANGVVVAGTRRATIRAAADVRGSHIGWNGCLSRLGTPFHLNGGPDGNGYNLNLAHVALAGDYAALHFVYTDKYTNYSDTINVYDLRSGALVHSTVRSCTGPPCNVTSLAMNPDGFPAWVATVTPEPPVRNMTAISCPTTALCVAGDQKGHILVSAAPFGGPTTWTRLTLPTSNAGISGISCPTTSLCVAVAGSDNVYWSTDPTGGAAAWHAISLGSTALQGVSCGSASLCVVIGLQTAYITTDPTGPASAWRAHSLVSVPTNLQTVSCPSSNLCVTGDSTGDVLASTDPADPSPSWTSNHPGGVVAGIDCPTVDLCAAISYGSSLLTTTDPTSATATWAAHPLDPSLGFPGSVTCGGPSLCLAAGGKTIITTTDPTDPSPSWIQTTLAQPVSVASCPAADRCVAAGGPDILTSTDPTGGASAWTGALVDESPCAPCLAETLTAVDDHGEHTLDTAPPGPGTVIAGLRFSGDTLNWTHAGAAKQTGLS